ncbi:rCG21163 [Rattus norvegicus]|uniref:RCG21163 n=1 Tax=Rattus norvegicus TaxID=10116 RepID=A6J1H9_RAT|nr:rCG21163 [Rattus norvegicus]
MALRVTGAEQHVFEKVGLWRQFLFCIVGDPINEQNSLMPKIDTEHKQNHTD